METKEFNYGISKNQWDILEKERLARVEESNSLEQFRPLCHWEDKCINSNLYQCVICKKNICRKHLVIKEWKYGKYVICYKCDLFKKYKEYNGK